jgi:hypothetical protein
VLTRHKAALGLALSVLPWACGGHTIDLGYVEIRGACSAVQQAQGDWPNLLRQSSSSVVYKPGRSRLSAVVMATRPVAHDEPDVAMQTCAATVRASIPQERLARPNTEIEKLFQADMNRCLDRAGAGNQIQWLVLRRDSVECGR